MTVRVILVDDHPVVLAGLAALLDGVPDFELAGQARSASQALALVRERGPGVVVLDMGLPGMNGVALAERIFEAAPETRIVMLTHFEDPGHVQNALRTGIRGYVLKSSPGDKVIQAIKTVQGGGLYIDSELEEFRSEWVRRQAQRCVRDSAPPPAGALSHREAQVLRLAATGHSNKEIARRIGLGVKSVETYRYRACKKLLLHSRLDIIRYGAEQGWFLVPQDVD
ncbi:response regulator transcription factor [Bosea sp. (in: a-proteobacteria)]|uniref:response regulator transcription factor n=1 Tax=Bosea sp. (in: a-proteobacteria) TaxID=1871050 RepID=UPI00262C2C90|nr:response regulator transcription factor [Bosea sp. (in: a-proteobacteria)]MCO5090985.1 response regulator transcription factor [Bosea sp. (in: a-proteobacteria)]